MRISAFKLLSVLLVLGLLAVIPIGCGQTHDDSYQKFSLNESPESSVGSSAVDKNANEASPQETAETQESKTEIGSETKEIQSTAQPDRVAEKVEVADASSDKTEIDENGNITSANPTSPDPKPKANADPDPLALGPDARTLPSNPLRPGLQPPAKLREVKLLVKDRKFKVEGPENSLRISYDDFDLLKILNMEPVTLDAPKLMPAWLTQLEGKRIRVRGFMYPPLQEEGLEGFVLARDNQICCFGRDPKPYDIVQVDMREGKTTHYILNVPFDVVGVFHIDPIELDGAVRMVYRIDDATVMEK